MRIVEDEKLIDMNNWCVFQYLKDINCRRINKTWVQTWNGASTERSQASQGITSLTFVVVFLTGDGVCPEVNPLQLPNITRILRGIRTDDGNTDGCLRECWNQQGWEFCRLTECCCCSSPSSQAFLYKLSFDNELPSFCANEKVVRYVIHQTWIRKEAKPQTTTCDSNMLIIILCVIRQTGGWLKRGRHS